jgi:HEAT repeats
MDPDPAVRVAALGAVARAGGIDAETWRAAMADPDGGVRRRACEEAGRALGRAAGRGADGSAAGVLGDAGTTLHAMVERLVCALGDGDPLVAEAAAWAIGEAGRAGSPAVEGLSTLAAAGTVTCREAAVAALGAIGDPTGLPVVLAALDDRPSVRRRAAVALAGFDDSRADAGLRRAAGDRDWQVRQVAEELLDER